MCRLSLHGVEFASHLWALGGMVGFEFWITHLDGVMPLDGMEFASFEWHGIYVMPLEFASCL